MTTNNIDLSQLKFVAKDLGSQHDKLYRKGDTFYLIDENDKLKGYITKSNKDERIFKVGDSYYKENVKSFHKIMFTLILATSEFEEIIASDYSQVANINNSSLEVRDTSITAKYNLKELLEDYYQRIYSLSYENNMPVGYRGEFLKHGRGIDNLLYCGLDY